MYFLKNFLFGTEMVFCLCWDKNPDLWQDSLVLYWGSQRILKPLARAQEDRLYNLTTDIKAKLSQEEEFWKDEGVLFSRVTKICVHDLTYVQEFKKKSGMCHYVSKKWWSISLMSNLILSGILDYLNCQCSFQREKRFVNYTTALFNAWAMFYFIWAVCLRMIHSVFIHCISVCPVYQCFDL